VARNLKDGVRMAEDLIHNGEARERMAQLRDFTALLKQQEEIQ
jgi:anthranilate phosphoribosyltransferase